MNATNGSAGPNGKDHQAAQNALSEEIKAEWAKRMEAAPAIERRYRAMRVKNTARHRRHAVLSLSSMALFFLIFAVGVIQVDMWAIVGIAGFSISAVLAESAMRKVRR